MQGKGVGVDRHTWVAGMAPSSWLRGGALITATAETVRALCFSIQVPGPSAPGFSKSTSHCLRLGNRVFSLRSSLSLSNSDNDSPFFTGFLDQYKRCFI